MNNLFKLFQVFFVIITLFATKAYALTCPANSEVIYVSGHGGACFCSAGYSGDPDWGCKPCPFGGDSTPGYCRLGDIAAGSMQSMPCTYTTIGDYAGCYKTVQKRMSNGVYMIKCDFLNEGASTDSDAYDDCDPVWTQSVVSCDAGYYGGIGTYGPSCVPVGDGYYSPDGSTARTKCPDAPSAMGESGITVTTGTTVASLITQCKKSFNESGSDSSGTFTFSTTSCNYQQ